MSKYTISIVQVIPNIGKDELSQLKKCYLGISINNPIFLRSSLGSIVSWIAQNYDECVIILGDYLHRHNEMALGKIQNEAIDLAMEKGNELHSRLNEYVKPYKSKFKISRWKDYLERPEYENFKSTLDECYNLDSAFRNTIDETAADFVSKQIQRNKKVENTAINLSKQYILEEMAVFCILIEEGYKIEIYPGQELPVFKMISEGKFPNVPDSLKKRINIEIKVLKT